MKKSGANRVRVGSGEVADRDSIVEASKNALLDAIRTETPHVLAALAAISPADTEAIETWARAYNLNAPWFRELARSTVRAWETSSQLARNRMWGKVFSPPYWEKNDLRSGLFEFSRFGWFPYMESRAEARKWLTGEFKVELKRHLDQVEASIPTQYTRSSTRKREHFQWTALYLCGKKADGTFGWSYTKLADHLTSDPHSVTDRVSTVRDAVKEVLTLVELPMPRRTGGRPKRNSKKGADS